MCDTPYSYHTFILPFKCEDLYQQCTLFKYNIYWKETTSLHNQDVQGNLKNRNQLISFYNDCQYFYPQVKNVLHDYNSDIFKSFTLSKNGRNITGNYIIKKSIDKKITEYNLDISAIRVVIYNTDIGLFIMECSNSHDCTLEAVKNINDYGRRIRLPYIPVDSDGYSSCADELTAELFIYNKKHSYTTTFQNKQQSEKTESQKIDKTISNSFISKKEASSKSSFIKEVKNNDFMTKFINEVINLGHKNALQVEPVMDDRMFVACAVKDKKETEAFLKAPTTKIKHETNIKNYGFELNSNLEKSIYEFIFIDSSGCCSCQNHNMREQLLKEHLYYRWLDYNSIYGVAAQSIVLLTDGGASFLIDYFLTEYVRIACLCLVQRASLLHFQEKTLKLSLEFTKESSYKKKSVKNLINLQEKFSIFESQMLFSEITPQEQGIELYDMFQKYYLIDREKSNVKSQLEGLFEASQTRQNDQFNNSTFILTLIGVFLAFLQVITGLFSIQNFCERLIFIIFSIILFVSVVIVYHCRNR